MLSEAHHSFCVCGGTVSGVHSLTLIKIVPRTFAHVSHLPYCCDKCLCQLVQVVTKQLKGERVYFDSQFRVLSTIKGSLLAQI